MDKKDTKAYYEVEQITTQDMIGALRELEEISGTNRDPLDLVREGLEAAVNENEDPFSITNVQRLIAEECDAIKELLLRKNKEYGNSALQPKRIFSSSSPVEQIKVRIDDKLSRLSTRGQKEIDEDTCGDLLGYLVLLRVAQKLYQ